MHVLLNHEAHHCDLNVGPSNVWLEREKQSEPKSENKNMNTSSKEKVYKISFF
jgi:hypothetical protein